MNPITLDSVSMQNLDQEKETGDFISNIDRVMIRMRVRRLAIWISTLISNNNFAQNINLPHYLMIHVATNKIYFSIVGSLSYQATELDNMCQ